MLERDTVTTVREAVVDDAEAITRVHIAGWQWGYRDLMPAAYLASLTDEFETRVQRRRRWLSRTDRTGALFVAVQHGAIVGFANAGPYRNNQDNDDIVHGIGEIYAIYVAEAAAGTAAGYELMNAAVAWLRERGQLPVRLWVLEGNTRALAFYNRYGFCSDGVSATDTIELAGRDPVRLPEIRLTLGG